MKLVLALIVGVAIHSVSALPLMTASDSIDKQCMSLTGTATGMQLCTSIKSVLPNTDANYKLFDCTKMVTLINTGICTPLALSGATNAALIVTNINYLSGNVSAWCALGGESNINPIPALTPLVIGDINSFVAAKPTLPFKLNLPANATFGMTKYLNSAIGYLNDCIYDYMWTLNSQVANSVYNSWQTNMNNLQAALSTSYQNGINLASNANIAFLSGLTLK